jgi:NAD(P)-dependent dehydrogenase (short-subunit alcohol dehydrogenase family)
MKMTKPVCVIVGVGPGNGASFARKFRQQGYQVVILARNEAYLAELSRQLDGAPFYSCDVTKVTQVESVFQKILRQFGEVDTLIYNAGAGQFKNVEDTTVEEFERSWQINALGCFVACKQLLPAMIDAGRGNFVVIGATASLRGSAKTAPFASAKAAQRSLAQSMARHLGPKGIHVSYVIVDGVIDLPRTRKHLADMPDEFFLKPDDIAQSVFTLVRQPRSAWTFELDLRPFGEKW